MIYFLKILATFGVLCSAFWAYSVNYDTRDALRDQSRITGEMRKLQKRKKILEAEWAYLNRPDRLRDLVELNFDTLKLVDLDGLHFGDIEEIPYPSSEGEDP